MIGTVFPTLGCSTKQPIASFEQLVGLLKSPREYPSKESQPLISLCEYGDVRTEKGSYKHAGNILSVCGLEGDYDKGKMSIAEATDRLKNVGIPAVLYPSYSATPENHRWRVILPLSKPYSITERNRFLARVNGVLGGNLSKESFSISQGFFFGRNPNQPYSVTSTFEDLTAGDCVDLLDGLDLIAIDGPGQKDESASHEQKRAPGDILTELLQGDDIHGNALRIVGRYVAKSLTDAEIKAFFKVLSSQVADNRGIERARALMGDELDRMIAGARAKGFGPYQENASTEEARRRQEQIERNILIGDGVETVTSTVELFTVKSALERFVFISDGSRVGDLSQPAHDLSLSDWVNKHAASVRTFVEGGKERRIPMSTEWKCHPDRKSVDTRTFRAGSDIFIRDPNGREAMNTWRPIIREGLPPLNNESLKVFLDHIEFLVPVQSRRERFLDWLAHIEQFPGVLPHTAWLHIAPSTGLGRNWLASVLVQVWPGAVAASFNLMETLNKGFNDRLSRKQLAIVDEIREGGRGSQWEHAERLKSLITEEHRLINPKYGRQSLEFNSCRWLLFSNHTSALPLDNTDRRVEVVINDSPPRAADYYARLYQAKDSPVFISSVARYLGQRDLSGFNPGEHAAKDDDKNRVITSNSTLIKDNALLVANHWPNDVITNRALYECLTGSTWYSNGECELSSAMNRALDEAGIEAVPKHISIKGVSYRYRIVRDRWLWNGADHDSIRAELMKDGGVLGGESGESAHERLMKLVPQ